MRVSKVYFVNEICSKGFPEMADKNKSRVGIDLMSTLNFVGVPPVLGHDTRTTPGFMESRYRVLSCPLQLFQLGQKVSGSAKSRDLTGYKQAGRFFSAAKS